MQFLLGKDFQEVTKGEFVLETRRMAWRRAKVMLSAEALLDACEFALTTLASLSSEDFSAGGDKQARHVLQNAFELATDSQFDPYKRFDECATAVRSSITENSANML